MNLPNYTSKSVDHFGLVSALFQEHGIAKFIDNQVIKTPIKTKDGYINPDKGIALRNPLSGLFSGLYLKALDDCFTACDVEYFRYQDDIIIFCPSYRSFKRCQLRLKRFLQQKNLTIATKKTKVGRIEQRFHFLGVDYVGTQTLSNSNSLGSEKESISMHLRRFFHQDVTKKEVGENFPEVPQCIQVMPHGRTLRRARSQVRAMVDDGASPRQIRLYLSLWAGWWCTAATRWRKKTLLQAWEVHCLDKTLAQAARGDSATSCSSLSHAKVPAKGFVFAPLPPGLVLP